MSLAFVWHDTENMFAFIVVYWILFMFGVDILQTAETQWITEAKFWYVSGLVHDSLFATLRPI